MAYDEDTLVDEIQTRSDTKVKLRQAIEDTKNITSRRVPKVVDSRGVRADKSAEFSDGTTRKLPRHPLQYGERMVLKARNGNVYDVGIQPRNFGDYRGLLRIIEYKAAEDSEEDVEMVQDFYIQFGHEQTVGIGNALLAIAEGRVERKQ